MTKLRPPLSASNAMTRVVGLIEHAEAARVCRKSVKWVYACMDPDRALCPSFNQAIALDTAYRAAGGEGAPFLETFSARVEVETAAALACHRALADDVAEVAREMGDAIAAGISAAQPGAGENTRVHAIVEAEQAGSALTRMIRRLRSFGQPVVEGVA